MLSMPSRIPSRMTEKSRKRRRRRRVQVKMPKASQQLTNLIRQCPHHECGPLIFLLAVLTPWCIQDVSDEYDNAWKANSAAAEAGSSQAAAPPQSSQPQNQVHAPAQSQPSSSTMTSVSTEVPAPSSTPAQPAPYTFAQPGPYVSYPYAGYAYFPQHAQSQNVPAHPHPGADQNGLKRPFGYGEGTPEVAILEPSQKRTRHCCKCGSQDCKGKGGRTFCLNACQDCGKIDCRGRNSRRPDKVCSEAWV